MTDLINRLKNINDGDRRKEDINIFKAFNPRYSDKGYVMDGDGFLKNEDGLKISPRVPIHFYTRDINQALLLVPSDKDVEMYLSKGKEKCYARISSVDGDSSYEANTLPVAICIAALSEL